jgi:hypothetical protein
MSNPSPLGMSVILLTPDCIETIRHTLRCLGAQSVKDCLEIVLVSPASAQLDLGDRDLRGFGDIQVVRLAAMSSTAAARAAGIRQSSAPVVAFVEDHSFPNPEWAATLIRAHEGSLAAVGPVIENANPGSAISWANLLIEYGEWLDSSPDHAPQHLPGHNSSYKRRILLDYGEKLELMIQAESVLHWDLRSHGFNIATERKARTKHLNFSRLAPSSQMRFWSARLFGASRVHDWSFLRRVVYVGGGPLIPLVRSLRILRHIRGRRWHYRQRIRVLAVVLFLLICDAGGEMVGYVFGPGCAEERVADFEFHRERYLSRGDADMWHRGALFQA